MMHTFNPSRRSVRNRTIAAILTGFFALIAPRFSGATPPESPSAPSVYQCGAPTAHGLAILDATTVLVSDSYASGRRSVMKVSLTQPENKDDAKDNAPAPPSSDQKPSSPSATTTFSALPYKQPCGLAVGPDGGVYVCDTEAARIYVLDGETGRLRTAFDTAGQPWNLRVLKDGTIWYLTADGRLHRRSPEGKTTLLRSSDGPVEVKTAFDLAIADDGTIYVTSQKPGTIVAVDPTDGSTRVHVDGLTNPEGIAIDDQNRVYVADTAAHRVYRIDADDKTRTILIDGPKIGMQLPICARIHNETLFITARDKEGQPLILTQVITCQESSSVP